MKYGIQSYRKLIFTSEKDDDLYFSMKIYYDYFSTKSYLWNFKNESVSKKFLKIIPKRTLLSFVEIKLYASLYIIFLIG